MTLLSCSFHVGFLHVWTQSKIKKWIPKSFFSFRLWNYKIQEFNLSEFSQFSRLPNRCELSLIIGIRKEYTLGAFQFLRVFFSTRHLRFLSISGNWGRTRTSNPNFVLLLNLWLLLNGRTDIFKIYIYTYVYYTYVFHKY